MQKILRQEIPISAFEELVRLVPGQFYFARKSRNACRSAMDIEDSSV